MAGSTTQPKIVQYGDPVLRERSRKVGRVTADLRRLVEQLVQAMRAAGGVGLAANQIGVPQRVAVIEIDGELTVLVDPELVSATGSEAANEGCLSLPRLYGVVERPTQAVVKARDLSGKRFTLEAEGLSVRALCHEIDHLNGKLFIDAVDPSTLYWLIGQSEEGEPVIKPIPVGELEDALRVFTAARLRGA
jgi:peptide deformylase